MSFKKIRVEKGGLITHYELEFERFRLGDRTGVNELLVCRNCAAVLPQPIEDIFNSERVSLTKEELNMILMSLQHTFQDGRSVEDLRNKLLLAVRHYYKKH